MSISPFLQEAQGAAARGDWTAARHAYQQALTLRPGDPGLLLQASRIESKAGHYRQARENTVAAARMPGADPQLALPMASRLCLFNEGPALLVYLRRFLPVQRMSLPLLLGFASQLSYLNLQEHALELLDEAKRADPDYPPTLVSRAQVLIYLGSFDEARAELQHCIGRVPELGHAWWLLARLAAVNDAPVQVDGIRRMLAKGGQSPRDVAFFQYALHQHLDRLGEYDAAWQALQVACAAMRALLPHDQDQTRRLFDALIARTLRPGRESTTSSTRTPIFIVGLHRSGTTLLEQLLDGHDNVQGMGELYDFTSQLRWAADHHCRGVLDECIVQRSETLELAGIANGYLRGLEWRLGKTRYFTDKLPSNLLNVGLICEALPQAKILRMVRDPVETCFCNLRELFSDVNPWSYDPLEMADYHRQSDRLAAHWHAAYPGRMLDVNYAALIRDPEAVLRQVAAFCGLEFQRGMLDIAMRKRAVATASAVQAREAVTAPKEPKWAPYRRQLAPMIRALQG